MGRKQSNERIVLPCKFGKLVCEVVSNDDEYKEFAIDLYRNDGKVSSSSRLFSLETDIFISLPPCIRRLDATRRTRHRSR